MRIVFMGTPDFAAVSLKRLYSDGHDICAVYTQPDKQHSRGMKLGTSAVKDLALQHNAAIYQPTTLRDGTVAQQLKELHPDLIAVVAYGKILPLDILSLPQLGCINIHGSILPKYRGAAPVQWAVINGEKVTGVTSMYMAPEMDAGDIIMTKTTAIGEDESAGALYDRLSTLGAELLSETLTAFLLGSVTRTKQNDENATFAPPLTKEMSPINWENSTRQILCQIRGLNPWPIATAELNGVLFKIFKAVGTEHQSGLVPGKIVNTGQDGIEISCADGTVIIKELQVSGSKRMAAADYLRGHPICR